MSRAKSASLRQVGDPLPLRAARPAPGGTPMQAEGGGTEPPTYATGQAVLDVKIAELEQWRDQNCPWRIDRADLVLSQGSFSGSLASSPAAPARSLVLGTTRPRWRP